MKEKQCKLCGELFLPTCSSNTICGRTHYAKCPICGKDLIWNTARKVQPCSQQCRKESTRLKNLAKYGVEHPMQSEEIQARHRQSMKDKYGVESPLQSSKIKEKAIESNRKKFGTDWALGSKEIKAKSEETMIKKYGARTTLESPALRKKVEQTCVLKYGVTNVARSREIRERMTSTNFMKYHVSNPMQNKEIRERAHATRIANNGAYWSEEMAEKMRKTSMEHYGYDNPSKSEEIKDKIREACIEKYGENYGNFLLRNVKHSAVSNINREFQAQMIRRGLPAHKEFREITHYSYDIYIENSPVLIEIDPTFTHNSIYNPWEETGKDMNYHLNKSKSAENSGYRCIHVFDWDDWNKVIDSVMPKTQLDVKDCTLYRINPKVADAFLDQHHIEGIDPKCVLHLGLVHDGQVMQMMSFGVPKDTHFYSEIRRVCTRPGVEIKDGYLSIFRYATNTLGINEIVAYCDVSKEDETIYSQIGMNHIGNLPPQLNWSKSDQRVVDDDTIDKDAMLADSWWPVYDCGRSIYSFSDANTII